MEAVSHILELLDANLGSAFWFPFALLGTGLFFTIYLGAPQIRYFAHAWRVLLGRYDRIGAPGDTTHFQALATALSGTVGTGNIGGVALALHLGGPAAMFWMWATAFLGMTTKFVEVTVSWKYRTKDEDGFIAGGPMYYMDRGLNMKWLAVFFAVATVISSFGSGNMPQSNNMAVGVEGSFGIPAWITGATFAVLLGLVIIGGISRIAMVAATLVPTMALAYTLGALAVISSNFDAVGPAFVSIFADAFTGSAAAGGFLGASFAYAFNRGVNRGLFSNEAGQGSAPIAHASAKGDEPVSEGLVAILEPFIDTIVICTLTGLAILASGVWIEKIENDFQRADMVVMAGAFDDRNTEDAGALRSYLIGVTDPQTAETFSGALAVVDGRVQGTAATILHNRSIAEGVRVMSDGAPWSGTMHIADGAVEDASLTFTGASLVHSVSLTAEAFSRSFLGEAGRYVVTLGLLLFAFSTAVAWSYYGDRAITYLFGTALVLPYRILYVVAFFVASVADTSLIWLVSYVTVALMTLPNLIGIVLLRREMRDAIKEYWVDFEARDDGPKRSDEPVD